MRLNMQQPDWYAMVTKPRSETAVLASLEAKGYDYLLPVQSVQRKCGKEMVTIDRPLFPGYIFCYFDPQKTSPLVTTPNVVRIISFGGKAMPLSQEEVFALRAIGQVRPPVEARDGLAAGRTVTLQGGPLKGLQGVLQASQKGTRLVVNVWMLQRSMAVEVEPAWISPVNSTNGLRCLSGAPFMAQNWDNAGFHINYGETK